MSDANKEPYEVILDQYRQIIKETHPDKLLVWPVLSGFNVRIGSYKGWTLFIFDHTGDALEIATRGIGELPLAPVGLSEISNSSRTEARRLVAKYLRLKPEDGLVMIGPDHKLKAEEFEYMLHMHEHVLGLVPMKIFLSHKGTDKGLVRQYKLLLSDLGFDPWIDEDALTAGAELERGIRKGFRDSCAAIFFITPNFKDESYLAAEVDYAIAEKREKQEKFAVITLVFAQDGKRGSVPELLHRYVWKEPQGDLQALHEILAALPIAVGSIYWKTP